MMLEWNGVIHHIIRTRILPKGGLEHLIMVDRKLIYVYEVP